jgi:hypothetical protein
MSTFKRRIKRSFIGAVAVAALALAASGGAGPAAHAEGGYPNGVYGPGGSCCFDMVGYWFDSGGYGYHGHALYTYSNGPYGATTVATWLASGLTPNTLYDVCAYIPSWDANANALYTLAPANYPSWEAYSALPVSQWAYSNQWAFVTSAQSDQYGRITVYLSDQSYDPAGSTVMAADAMVFAPDPIANVQGDGSCLPPDV